MAEDKKKDSKSSSGSNGGGDGFYSNVLLWVLFIPVLWYVIKYLARLAGLSFTSFPSFSSIFASIFGPVQVISIFLSLVFVLGIIYTKFKIKQLTDQHHDHHQSSHDSHANHAVQTEVSNKRWDNIEKRMATGAEADWRLAIIECDILLNEMLIKMGYQGDSVADKLKRVEKSDFHTIEEAWEAHKTRNLIAHSGSEYHMSRSEAEDTFKKYRHVFEEFFFI